MDDRKFFVHKSLWFLAAVVVLGCFAGCQPGQVVEEKEVVLAPVFFPKPPDKPRLQFLKAFAGGPVTEQSAGFEHWIVGEEDRTQKQAEGIAKPYGLGIYDGKIYVCDVVRRRVQVLDIETEEVHTLTDDMRISAPGNIWIEQDGTKYVLDSRGGGIFVFDSSDQLKAIYGRELGMRPIDAVTHGQRLYIADGASDQVVVLDKTTGELILRIGKRGEELGEIKFIGGVGVDSDGNAYITDRVKGRIGKYDPQGKYLDTIGKLGDGIHEFVRPKGLQIDSEGRIWVVDNGTDIAKIYNSKGQLLMFFGGTGIERGQMTLPVEIVLDRKHVGVFKKYAVEGAQLEFLVIVANQFGPQKISVFGFGTFPEASDNKNSGLQSGPQPSGGG